MKYHKLVQDCKTVFFHMWLVWYSSSIQNSSKITKTVATPITIVECLFSDEHDKTAGRFEFLPHIYTNQRGG